MGNIKNWIIGKLGGVELKEFENLKNDYVNIYENNVIIGEENIELNKVIQNYKDNSPMLNLEVYETIREVKKISQNYLLNRNLDYNFEIERQVEDNLYKGIFKQLKDSGAIEMEKYETNYNGEIHYKATLRFL